jgi:hypothetical protein
VYKLTGFRGKVPQKWRLFLVVDSLRIWLKTPRSSIVVDCEEVGKQQNAAESSRKVVKRIIWIRKKEYA